MLISENYHVDIIFMYSKGDNRLILVNYLIPSIMFQAILSSTLHNTLCTEQRDLLGHVTNEYYALLRYK